MPKLFACATVIALLAGLVTFAASPASAADLGTVNVTYNSGTFDYTISPSTLTGAVGDTFTLRNTMISVSSYVSLVNATGSVTVGGTACTSSSVVACRVTDAGGTATGVFAISGTGSVTVFRFTSGALSSIGTLTISGGGSSVVTASVTMSFDANGGNCTDNPLRKSGFAGATYVLPTAVECTKANYSLAGWAFSRDAIEPATPNTGAGATVNFVVSETMYAVWVPDGVEITYDANIALEDQCLSEGTNLTTAASRKSTPVVLATPFTLATSARCNPANTDLKLAGWATHGNGDSIGGVNTAGEPVIARGTKVTLYAIWQVAISCATGGGAAGTCVVGDTGPGGGKVFYVNPSNATGSRYMEAAPNTWNGGAADPTIAWCSKTTTSLGSFGARIGTGKANTDLMVATGACTSGAANSIRAYTGGGVSWFLPSIDELNALYSQRTVVGGFAADYYWSSSQYGSDKAWGQGFASGSQEKGRKLFPSRVRPVRAF